MQFNFASSPKKQTQGDIHLPKELELWTPVEEKPGLNAREMNSILREDQVIETMHIAIPSFLIQTEDGNLGYYPCMDFDRYFIVAKLSQSPYLVFHEEKVASKNMQKHIQEGFKRNSSAYYLLDLFFTPFFGGITPRYFLFQRANVTTIPETIILFRDVT